MVLAQKIISTILGCSLLSLLMACPDKNQPEAKEPQVNVALMIVKEERIEPVAIYQADSQKWVDPLQELGDISDPKLLNQKHQSQIQQYLPLNQPLELYQMGQNKGQFTPQKIGLFGCGDFAHVSGSYNRPELKSQALIAFSQGFQGKKSFAAPVWSVPQLKQIAKDLAKRQFQASGYAMADLPLEVLTYEPVTLEASGQWINILFVSAHIPHPEPSFACGPAKLWLVAEGDPHQMQVKFFEITKEADDFGACGDHELVSTFALNSEINQFLLANSGHEWWDYSIIQRQTSGKYEKIYQGGGGAC